MSVETYKGHRIELQRTNKWVTIITRPGSRQFIGGTPRATLQEGEEVALKRAHGFIDQQEEKKNSAQ
jgi:hypothetical protein